MNIAIITGASSGLGTEYYKVIQDEVLDEVWIIARREGALNEISQKYGKIKTRVIPLDLTIDESHEKLLNILKEEKPSIKYLFNNAGFGAYGKLDEIDLLKQTNMIDLNVKALTKITYYALGYMQEGAKIINTASIVAFAPIPNMAVYSATKKYVMSFSRALRHELRKRKINVTAVCPGAMATEFFTVAGVDSDKKSLINRMPFCNTAKVAKNGFKAAKRGRAVYTPRLLYKFLRLVGKIVPHSILIKFVSA